MQQNKKNRLWLIWILGLVITLADSDLKVFAQGIPTLMIDPADSNLPIDSELSIDILVMDAINVNAYDITITYNSAYLELVSWAHGDYLSNLAVVKKEEEPGKFQLVCTQLATPAVSGDGILLTLILKGVSAGYSDIRIEAIEFADSRGISTYPQVENGGVDVSLSPTHTQTATYTQTPIATNTSTVTYTPTPVISNTQTPTQPQTQVLPLSQTATQARNPILNELTPIINAEASLQVPPGAPGLLEGESGENKQQERLEYKQEQIDAQNSDQLRTQDQNSESVKNETFLWIILITGFIALLVIIYVLVTKRRKQTKEDYLL